MIHVKSVNFRPRVTVSVLAILALTLSLSGLVFLKVKNSNSPWHVGIGWGICGGYSTKYLKEIPTDIYPTIDAYFHTTFGTALYDKATAVDPKKESTTPHKCTAPLEEIRATDPTIALTRPNQVTAVLAKARKRYSGVIPPGATKALQIQVAEYLPWPTYTGHDPYVLNLQVISPTSLMNGYDLILGYYPGRGWVVVYKYSDSDGPFFGYPPTGS
jgi:hypothetical protein